MLNTFQDLYADADAVYKALCSPAINFQTAV